MQKLIFKLIRFVYVFIFILLINEVFAEVYPIDVVKKYVLCKESKDLESIYNIISDYDKLFITKDEFINLPKHIISNEIGDKYYGLFKFTVLSENTIDKNHASVKIMVKGPFNLFQEALDELESNINQVNRKLNIDNLFQDILLKKMEKKEYYINEKESFVELLNEKGEWKIYLNIEMTNKISLAMQKYNEASNIYFNSLKNSGEEKKSGFKNAIEKYNEAKSIILSIKYISKRDEQNINKLINNLENKIENIKMDIN